MDWLCEIKCLTCLRIPIPALKTIAGSGGILRFHCIRAIRDQLLLNLDRFRTFKPNSMADFHRDLCENCRSGYAGCPDDRTSGRNSMDDAVCIDRSNSRITAAPVDISVARTGRQNIRCQRPILSLFQKACRFVYDLDVGNLCRAAGVWRNGHFAGVFHGRIQYGFHRDHCGAAAADCRHQTVVIDLNDRRVGRSPLQAVNITGRLRRCSECAAPALEEGQRVLAQTDRRNRLGVLRLVTKDLELIH